MVLSMATRREVIERYAGEYRRARESEKTLVLDCVVSVTGYHRKYVAWLLRNHGRRIRAGCGRVLLADARLEGRGSGNGKRERRRRAVYDAEVKAVLVQLWALWDYICGKRLVCALREQLPGRVADGTLAVSAGVMQKLMRMSASTADRLLASERRKEAGYRRRRLTRPGSLLRHQIPVRTFSDWSDAEVGFVEADLVAHDGGNSSGDYCYTLDMVDVRTGWVEQVAVLNRAQRWVFEALKGVRLRLPFPLLALDSDNGSEFIKAHLRRYCDAEGIVFTRSRPYRKNDPCPESFRGAICGAKELVGGSSLCGVPSVRGSRGRGLA